MESENHEPVEIEDVQAVKDSAPGYKNKGALLCMCPSPRANRPALQRWIPKALIDDDSEVYDAQEHAKGTLVIPLWLAMEKDLA